MPGGGGTFRIDLYIGVTCSLASVLAPAPREGPIKLDDRRRWYTRLLPSRAAYVHLCFEKGCANMMNFSGIWLFDCIGQFREEDMLCGQTTGAWAEKLEWIQLFHSYTHTHTHTHTQTYIYTHTCHLPSIDPSPSCFSCSLSLFV